MQIAMYKFTSTSGSHTSPKYIGIICHQRLWLPKVKGFAGVRLNIQIMVPKIVRINGRKIISG
jgi:hypothetical protein